MSFAYLDPEAHVMTVNANPDQIRLAQEPDGTVTVTILELTDGVEVHQSDSRLWRPVE